MLLLIVVLNNILCYEKWTGNFIHIFTTESHKFAAAHSESSQTSHL